MTEEPDTHADIIKDVVADSIGSFAVDFYDVQEHDLGVTFTLTATGQVSGSKATAVFTDNRVITSVELLNPATNAFVSAPSQITVPSGGSITIRATGTTTGDGGGGAAADDWQSTRWRLRGPSPSNGDAGSGCSNTVNVTAATVGATHTFSITAPVGGGVYTVDVTAFRSDGCVDGPSVQVSYADGVKVEGTASPTAVPGGPYLGDEGSSVALDGSQSTNAVSYSWSYSVVTADAGASCAITNATSATPSIECNDDGEYSVKLTVKNSSNVTSAEVATTLTVSNVVPTATFTASPNPVTGGSSVSLSLANGDDEGDNDDAGLQYAFACGAGAYTALGSTSTGSCLASGGSGSLTVKGKIQDKDGGFSEYSTSVAINNAPPQASAGSAYSGNEGDQIDVSGSGSDPDGGTVTYKWSATPGVGTLGTCSFVNDEVPVTKVSCTDNGTYALTLTVKDDEEATTASDPATLTVANVAPTATFNAQSPVNEGSSFNLSLANPEDPSSVDATQLQYAFDCGDGNGYNGFSSMTSRTCPTNDNGGRSVKGKIKDKDGGVSEYTAAVTVDNVAPVAAFGTNSPVDEGSNISLSLTNAFDPSTIDAASLQYAFDCGDGNGYTSFSSTSTRSCPTTDNGSRAVKGKIRDKDEGVTEYNATVTINNVAPTATFNAPSPVTEGSAIALSLTGGTDVSSADIEAGFTYAFDCGSGSGYGAFGASNSTSCSTSDNGNRTVKGKIRDKDGGETEYTKLVTVTNANPVLGVITIAPSALVALGTTITASATFTDAGTSDTHTGTYSWDDGTTSSAIISESNGSGSASATKKYAATGVYLVKLTLNDDDGGPASAEYRYVVVYDPNAGFVTGGGWIISPSNACAVFCAGASGKAHFGFVSKYKRGATVPEGDTEFQFQAGNLNFKSTVYEWLVVSGARGQYKGSGTINGTGNYGFLLTAVDGQINGGGNMDKFRIKIWDKGTGNVVYDNQPSAEDNDLDAGTVISGGSIVIHSK